MTQRDLFSDRSVGLRMVGALFVMVLVAAAWGLLAPGLAAGLREQLASLGRWGVVAFVLGGALWVLLCAPAGLLELWQWLLMGAGLLATLGAAWLVGHAAHGAWRSRPAQGRRSRPTGPSEPDPALRPALLEDPDGEPRQVGVEIEFRRLPREHASQTIARLWGGRVEREHVYALRVCGTELGDFRVELDSHPLSELAEKLRRGERVGVFERLRAFPLRLIARKWTPSEITSPPLPFERLAELDRLVHALGRAGAQGTDHGLVSPLGVHFNPTVPSRDARVLRDYLRAYIALRGRLVDELDVDPSRHALRYAAPYPAAYCRLVLDASYAPDLPRLIDDYLLHNPTRNRGLDMLPLFAELDPQRVRRALDDPRIKPRPTFHFRLPNSRIGDTSWCVTDEWRVWLEVEGLAADPDRLAACCAELRDSQKTQLGPPWRSAVERWRNTSPRLAPHTTPQRKEEQSE